MNTALTMAENMGDHVYLVDGSGYIFRAFYGIMSLATKDGFPTNALFGFTRMLLKTIKDADSTRVVVVFDAGKRTFRNDLYAEYKANRTECPPELSQQMPYFREICRAMGLTVLEQPGYEADDIIGTLTKRLVNRGHGVVVVSGDKDLMQLVNDNVTIWDTMKDQRFGAKGVEEKFGVPPGKVVEVLALMGDQSDNVPGLDGVGPKTATQLVQKYGDVESIIAATDSIAEDSTLRNRKKIAETIRTNVEILRLSRRLVEIDCNMPLECEGKAVDGEDPCEFIERGSPDAEKLTELFTRFEFTSLLAEILGAAGHKKAANPAASYRTVWADGFDAWAEQLAREPEWAFDCETTSICALDSKIIGVGFSWKDDEAWYVPIAHVEAEQDQVSWDKFRDALGLLFANPSIKKIGQNLKYDLNALSANGIRVEGVAFDTMIAAYLLNPDRRSYNLTVLSNELLNRSVIEFDDLVEKGQDFSVVPVAKATEYTCQDAHFAWLLRSILTQKLEEKELTRVFSDIEMPLVPVLARMEQAGIKVDVALLSDMSREFEGLLKTLEEKIYAAAGASFNINSPKQLADLLFTKLGISTKGVKKTKTGLSTDSSVLERISDQHPVPALVLEYRMLHKLKSTYVDALPTYVLPRTGRVHTSFNQALTGTGRLSSSDPNLQNIPIQSSEGRRIRTAFVPEPGNIFVSADYSQIELRLLAHLSEDANLIAAFNAGHDIHAQTTREVLGLPEDALIGSDQRRIGKTINFGIVYGMGPFRLARDLGITVAQASQYISNYFCRYPRVKEYFTRVETEAMSTDTVKTILGRKRFVSAIDPSGRDQGFTMRAALNAPLQGSAADIIKLAMIRIDRILPEIDPGAALVLQVHDELLIELPDPGADSHPAIVDRIQREMESVLPLSVPLQVDIGVQRNWNDG